MKTYILAVAAWVYCFGFSLAYIKSDLLQIAVKILEVGETLDFVSNFTSGDNLLDKLENLIASASMVSTSLRVIDDENCGENSSGDVVAFASVESFRKCPVAIDGSKTIVVFLPSRELRRQIEIFREKLSLNINTNIYLVEKKESGVNVLEIYKVGSQFRIEQACPSDEICNPKDTKWTRRTDLTGLHLEAVIGQYEPLVMYDPNDLDAAPWGVFPELFHEVQRLTNFTYSMRESVDGNWGSLSQDGLEYDGIVGMLQRAEVDVCIAGLDMRAKRAAIALDYSSAVIMDTCRIFVKSGSAELGLKYEEIFTVYSSPSWAGIAVLTIVATSALFATYHWEKCSRPLLTNLGDSFAQTSRALILKGHSRQPQLFGGKTVMMSVLLFGFFIFSLFRGGILSKLAVHIAHYPLADLADIPGTNLILGTIGGATTSSYFEDANRDSPQKKVWPIVRRNLEKDNESGLKRVAEDDNFAFFMYENAGKASDLYPCQVSIVGPGYLKINEAFGFPRGSPLKDLFDYHLVRMRENGILYKIVAKWQMDNSLRVTCQHDIGSELGVGDLLGIFLILCSGLTLACVSVLLERLAYHAFKKGKTSVVDHRAQSHDAEILLLLKFFRRISSLSRRNPQAAREWLAAFNELLKIE